MGWGMSAGAASCRMCAKSFERRSSLAQVCSPRCALRSVKVAKQAEKEERRTTRLKLLELKPRSKWLKEAQQAFNAWIRARDEALPCVSCGRHHEGQYHAGHYLTVGARPELRFDPMNAHKQCSACNTHLHGNIVLYRVELLKRIGADEVERLEGPHPPLKLSIEELREIRDSYRRQTREMQR